MTGEKSGVSFVERLTPLLAAGDLVGAHELLTGLDGGELAEAKKWFASSARWCRDLYGNVDFVGADHDEKFIAYHDACWIVAMCAVFLAGPRTAAERVPWASCWDFMQHGGEAAFVHVLWDRPADWVAEFVDAASRARLGGQARNTNGNLARVLRAAVVHHDLPCPTGGTFLREWLAGTPMMSRFGRSETSLADWLAVDPLMPDLLHLFLASGECGQWPGLPDAVADLVRKGELDRAPVVETVLEQLTTAQRSKSQRVLVAILAALDVSASEVPGGLDYLLGVLASGDRAVQPVLLPLAFELAERAEDWTALADLVAGRPEKKPKELLLAALKQPRALAAAGSSALAAALDVLGSVDDVAFATKVQATRSALGVEAPAPLEEPGILGLWEQPPTRSATGVQRPWMYGRWGPDPEWGDLLSTAYDRREDLRPWLVEEVLTAMAQGSYDESAIVQGAAQKLAVQEFSCSSAVTTFEDLFLAGGLRQSWRTALSVADLAAGAPVRPAGLADLLRLLVRYAAEVPDRSALPPRLAALAQDSSGSKAAMEARALAAALGHRVDLLVAPVPARESTGAWDREEPHTLTLPSTVSLADDPIAARGADLDGLRDLLSEDFNGWAQSFGDICWWPDGYQQLPSLTSLTEPDRVLAATVTAIHRHGIDGARAALSGIERHYGSVDVVGAVDAWAEDALDVATFWRVAHEPVVSVSDLTDRWRADGVAPEESRRRREGLPSFGARLRSPVVPEQGALVVPTELQAPLDRFAFLRAVEALLRAVDEPVVLSLPTWADGTLDVEVLVARLEAVARGTGVVGPLDLVQALHRLREVDASVIDRVPAGLRTDPRFTHPDGAQTWDATDLVQRWLGSGGLPDLTPRAEDGAWTGSPQPAVPFTSLEAWPAELADDPWCPGPIPSALRLHPRWTDRCFADAYDAWSIFDPRHLPSLAPGPLGVPFHDRLLALLTPEYNQKHFQGLPTLVVLARAGRLVPAAAAAAARGRHESGTLGLGLLVKVLQRGLDASLRGLWPSSLAIAGALCDVEKRPPQLAELLRLLATYAHEVPPTAAEPPPGLVAFAGAKGATKAHEAARDLIALLRGPGSS